MSDETKTVATWVYGPAGESKLLDLTQGAPAPKGWAFEPPSGVVVVVEGAAASSPATPRNVQGSADGRFADLHDRLSMVEFRLTGVMAKLDAMSQPAEPAPVEKPANPERDALVARARELNIDFHHRTGEDKLRALITEAEADAKASEA